VKKLKYSKHIAKKVKELIGNGVSITVILDSVQKYQEAPRSINTLYKIYGEDIAEVRAAFHGYLGQKARERIDAGSDAVLIHALKTKAGWTEKVIVEERDSDDPDENTDAISTLAVLLGRNKT
jgi:hypothetical protein